MAKPPPKPPKPSRVTIPERCHPAAKIVFAEMARQGVSYDELEHRSGVLKCTFKAWRTDNRPGLETMEAVLGSLGWAYLPVPRLEYLPPEIQVGLQALAAQWEGVNPTLCQLMATVARAPIMRAAEPAPAEPSAARRRKMRQPNPDQVPLFEFDSAA